MPDDKKTNDEYINATVSFEKGDMKYIDRQAKKLRLNNRSLMLRIMIEEYRKNHKEDK